MCIRDTCVPQLAWDAGAGGAGRLTIVIPGLEYLFEAQGNPTQPVVAQFDLTSSLITFKSAARSAHAQSHYRFGMPSGGRASRPRRFGGSR